MRPPAYLGEPWYARARACPIVSFHRTFPARRPGKRPTSLFFFWHSPLLPVAGSLGGPVLALRRPRAWPLCARRQRLRWSPVRGHRCGQRHWRSVPMSLLEERGREGNCQIGELEGVHLMCTPFLLFFSSFSSSPVLPILPLSMLSSCPRPIATHSGPPDPMTSSLSTAAAFYPRALVVLPLVVRDTNTYTYPAALCDIWLPGHAFRFVATATGVPPPAMGALTTAVRSVGPNNLHNAYTPAAADHLCLVRFVRAAVSLGLDLPSRCRCRRTSPWGATCWSMRRSMARA